MLRLFCDHGQTRLGQRVGEFDLVVVHVLAVLRPPGHDNRDLACADGVTYGPGPRMQDQQIRLFDPFLEVLHPHEGGPLEARKPEGSMPVLHKDRLRQAACKTCDRL